MNPKELYTNTGKIFYDYTTYPRTDKGSGEHYSSKCLWKFINKIVDNPYKQKLVLDLGCGEGYDVATLGMLLERRAKVIGLESSHSGIRLSRSRGNDVVQAVAEHLPFASNSLDGVHMKDVLVHLSQRSKKQVFFGVSEILKKGGVFLISSAEGLPLHKLTKQYVWDKDQLNLFAIEANLKMTYFSSEFIECDDWYTRGPVLKHYFLYEKV